MTASVIAIGALSALGVGEGAYVDVPSAGAARTCIAKDPELATAGLTRPSAARIRRLTPATEDPALSFLLEAMVQVVSQLDANEPGWRKRRVALCLGTSSGAMTTAERLFDARAAGAVVGADVAAASTYCAPFLRARKYLDAITTVVRARQVVAACASSTIAIGTGMRWLEDGECELVIAGGYDAIALFVAAGFESLRATSASLPRPFGLARDGMCLGEGAAVVAMVPGRRASLFSITGFGASTDAGHITAPDRDALGLSRSVDMALAEARLPAKCIDLVSAHGTATPYNDAAEAKAIARIRPEPAPWVHAFKSQIGHTLGAAGVLELCAAGHAIRTQRVPPTFSPDGVDGTLDPGARVRLAAAYTAAGLDGALKLSAAFGGVTAALVVEQSDRLERGDRLPEPRLKLRETSVVVSAWGAVDASFDTAELAIETAIPVNKLARIDTLGRLSLSAVVALKRALAQGQSFDGAGVVAGYHLATLDTNERFADRIRRKGPRFADPRIFPATSPNAGPSQVAIGFNLTGPNFAVCSGSQSGCEAVAAAAEWIACGLVPQMVVVVADEMGSASQYWWDEVDPSGVRPASGAVAMLLSRHGAGGSSVAGPTLRDGHGHEGLRRWLKDLSQQKPFDWRQGA